MSQTAAAAVADGAFYNAGQSCCSVERIYVHETSTPQFVDAFVADGEGYRVGDPMDEATYIGADHAAEQLDVLRRQVADARRRARVAHRRRGDQRKGNWFAPTVLVDVDH